MIETHWFIWNETQLRYLASLFVDTTVSIVDSNHVGDTQTFNVWLYDAFSPSGHTNNKKYDVPCKLHSNAIIFG